MSYQQPPPASSGGAATGLGIAALICGAVAILGAWVPFCGILTLPLSGLGLALGIVGFIVALVSKGRFMLPILGSIVSVVALVLPFAILAVIGVAGQKIGPELEQQRQQAEREALTAATTQSTSEGLDINVFQYNRVQEGMDYNQVVGILGGPGNSHSPASGFLKTTVYTWTTKSGAVISGSFMQDKLIKKNQIGLQ
jgi:hypothetical protein